MTSSLASRNALYHSCNCRKHAQELRSEGVTQGATARLFSNPAGDYGSMVNERVGAGNWESSEELGDTWAARNAFSYGALDASAVEADLACLVTHEAV